MSVGEFIPISVATLAPSDSMGMDLYTREEGSGKVVLYRGGGYPLNPEDLTKLRDRGIHRLFIPKQASEAYQKYLRDIINRDDSRGASPAARAGAMNEVVRDVLQNSFSQSDTDSTVSAVKELGSVTSDIVSRDEFAAADLFNVLHHDYATFTHSANVAFYCAILASELGHDANTVEKITVGGLLHDLGKLEIDEQILCKPGKLNEKEFRRVKLHPTIGFRKLARREDLCEGQLMMVYQHHERNDGGGYPVGIREPEIHPWAKICAVVDVFEAVTSHRPYRSPLPHSKALEIIERDSGKTFDEEVVRCWKAIISRGSHN